MKLSIKVKKIKYLMVFFVLVVVGIQFFDEIRSRNLKNMLRTPFLLLKRRKNWRWLYSDPSSCTPVRNVAYLKVHRTASSAIQAILFRFGIKNGLHFALPRKSNYFGKGRRFTSDMIPEEILGKFPINIFAIHTKWDFKEIRSVMPPDTVYIASVREPTALFESLFSYGEFQEKTGLNIDRYVAYTPENAERLQNFLGFNQMTWDFGLSNEELYNETAIQNLIEEADENFDLVLVAEKLAESLVLLRHLLCWDIEDVVTLKVNARQDRFKSRLRNVTAAILKKKLFPDILLYDHFNHKLEDFTKRFGRNKMAKEVEELKATGEKIRRQCKLKESRPEDLKKGLNRPYSRKVTGYRGNLQDESCQLFIIDELTMIEQTRRRQGVQTFNTFGHVAAASESRLLRDAVISGGIPITNENILEILKKFKGLNTTKTQS